MLNKVILMVTSASASIATCLVAFNAVTPAQGAAIGSVISALAVGWHAAQLKSGGGASQ